MKRASILIAAGVALLGSASLAYAEGETVSA